MTLEICENLDLKKATIKESRFFRERFSLIVSEEQNLVYEKIGDDLYHNKRAFYFPVFENYIFVPGSRNIDEKNKTLKFIGTIIEEDEIQMIKSVIKNHNIEEKEAYKQYKNNLDKEVSGFIASLNNEIGNQKDFLKQSFLTENQFNENVGLLIRNYAEIISMKLANESTLSPEDKGKINAFYGNMIEGIRKNTLNIENNDSSDESPDEQQVEVEQ
ncbi:MAG: hypothetical protein PHU65_05870 [Actinomycetota bacterium]|jgi:hypothetical protein|nr:hypothetical protein [Actinomycetota bacterium]